MRHPYRWPWLSGALAAALFFSLPQAGRAAPDAVAQDGPDGSTAPIRTAARQSAARASAAQVSDGASAQAHPIARTDFPHGGSLQVRPARLVPGGFFEFEIHLAGIESPALCLGQSRFETFLVEPGRWRGYGAVRADATPGKAELAVEWRTRGQARREKAWLDIAPKEFPRRKLTVAGKFTKPSAEQKARNRADQKAFAAAYAAPMAAPMFSENFANPVSETARITSVFGVRRIFNGQTKSRHLGLDLDGEIGTPIYAAADGVVRMKRDCFYAGKAIVLSHGAGIFTAYFHLSAFAVEEGARVEKGQLLGMMGKTGRVTGPHLHLTAKVGGTTFDPQSLLDFDFFPEAPAPPLAKGSSALP